MCSEQENGNLYLLFYFFVFFWLSTQKLKIGIIIITVVGNEGNEIREKWVRKKKKQQNLKQHF